MRLARRVVATTTWSVTASAVATGLAVLLVSRSGLGLGWTLLAGVLAAVAAGLLAHLVTRARVKPLLDRLEALAGAVRRLAEPGHRQARLPELGDAEGVGLARAINTLMDQVRDELAASEADVRLLRSLVENSPNGVLVCRPDGRIRTVNQAFRQMFEVRGDPVGRRPVEVLSIPEVQELVDLARAGGAEDEVRIVPGARHVVLRPIVTEGGEVGVLAQDVTRWRAAERARTDFVANVSHELRTPMAAILGYADTLAHDAERLPDDMVPLVEAVARNSRRLRDTFEGLMHLATVEARLGELERETLRLQPLLVEAVLPAVDAAGRKDITFSLDCPDEVWGVTNAEALDVIVSNLATNAVKYTPAGGTVEVRVHADDEAVRIAVHDTGIGIEPAHQERVFERFFRVDEGRAREVGGTGLGLAMVKHLALATGARITLQSTPGEGSTFTVHLPAADPPDDELDDVDEEVP